MLQAFIRYVLIEGKVDDLKKRYPGDDDIIDRLAAGDPTPNKKYLPWMMRQYFEWRRETMNGPPEALQSVMMPHVIRDEIDVIRFFHDSLPRLKGSERDIDRYSINDLKDLQDELGLSKKKQRKAKKNDVVQVYDDEMWRAMVPMSREASYCYGTRQWCISRLHGDAFEPPTNRSAYLFIFDKRHGFKFVVELGKTADGHTVLSLWDHENRVHDNWDEIHSEIPADQLTPILQAFAKKFPQFSDIMTWKQDDG